MPLELGSLDAGLLGARVKTPYQGIIVGASIIANIPSIAIVSDTSNICNIFQNDIGFEGS